MVSGPIVAIAWRGPNAIALVRKNITDSTRSNRMGTLRGNYSMFSAHFTKRGDVKLTAKNVCHASENREEAESEVRIWFPEFY
jgi:nucleoside diphosphate kinase